MCIYLVITFKISTFEALGWVEVRWYAERGNMPVKSVKYKCRKWTDCNVWKEEVSHRKASKIGREKFVA